MIDNVKLNKTINDCASAGYAIKVKDISYVLLCNVYEDVAVAYKSLFEPTSGSAINEYHNSSRINFLRNYINSNFKDTPTPKVKRKKSNTEDITFDENKAEIINLIKETQKALEEGKIKSADALKIQADLRVKLNDKFQVKEEFKDQIVIVNCKYNSICDCGREIYIPTKEDLMKEYNLVEK